MKSAFVARLSKGIATIAFFSSVSCAYAADRMALVIANQGYGNTIGRLTQSLEGGRRVAAALSDSRFDVTHRSDLDLERLVAEIGTFAAKVRSEGAAARAAGKRLTTFTFFTGHGLADRDGSNFLVPIRSSAIVREQLAASGVAVSTVIDRLVAAAPDANHIIVLDACRTQLDDRGQQIATAAGFQLRTLAKLPAGVQVTFSTSPERPAADTPLFATALSKWIVRANTDHQVAFEKLMHEVYAASGETQQPTSLGSLHEAVRLGFSIDRDDADDRRRYEVAGGSALVFKHDGTAYSRADDNAGIVEVLGRGTVRRAAGKAPEIFRVVVDGTADWFSYRTLWGRAYVRSSLVSLQ